MASNNHGGYREPSKPAAVSGPGALSKRTDGGPSQVRSAVPDQPYGDATQQMNSQRTAPMAAEAPLPPTPQVPSGQAGGPSAPPSPPYGGGEFGGPSNRPHEPVTSGVPIGPGSGPIFSQTPAMRPSGAMTKMLQQLSAADATGVIAQLYQAASNRGV